jgi:hypothetical protein
MSTSNMSQYELGHLILLLRKFADPDLSIPWEISADVTRGNGRLAFFLGEPWVADAPPLELASSTTRQGVLATSNALLAATLAEVLFAMTSEDLATAPKAAEDPKPTPTGPKPSDWLEGVPSIDVLRDMASLFPTTARGGSSWLARHRPSGAIKGILLRVEDGMEEAYAPVPGDWVGLRDPIPDNPDLDWWRESLLVSDFLPCRQDLVPLCLLTDDPRALAASTATYVLSFIAAADRSKSANYPWLVRAVDTLRQVGMLMASPSADNPATSQAVFLGQLDSMKYLLEATLRYIVRETSKVMK